MYQAACQRLIRTSLKMAALACPAAALLAQQQITHCIPLSPSLACLFPSSSRYQCFASQSVAEQACKIHSHLEVWCFGRPSTSQAQISFRCSSTRRSFKDFEHSRSSFGYGFWPLLAALLQASLQLPSSVLLLLLRCTARTGRLQRFVARHGRPPEV